MVKKNKKKQTVSASCYNLWFITPVQAFRVRVILQNETWHLKQKWWKFLYATREESRTQNIKRIETIHFDHLSSTKHRDGDERVVLAVELMVLMIRKLQWIEKPVSFQIPSCSHVLSSHSFSIVSAHSTLLFAVCELW
jgi:hypothetical protein